MSARRPSLRLAFGVALSVALSAWFLWTVQWNALVDALGSVNPWPVFLASTVMLLEFVLRAARWKVLLRPIRPDVPLTALFSATVIGATANTLLPARAGEIVKPLVASRRTGLPFSALLASTVMERVFDIFGLLTVLMTLVFVLPPDVGKTPEDMELVSNLRLYGGLFGVAAMACMLFFFVLVSRGQDAKRIFSALTKLAPGPVARRFDSFFDGFVEGLAGAKSLSVIVQAAVLSMLLWFNGVLAIRLLFEAFSLDLHLGAACFTAVAIALTVAVPQGPGFFGVFHVAIEKTMVLWAVPVAPAKAFAIVFWGVSFIPVTIVGLLAIWREGLSLSGIWSGKEEAQ